MAKKTKKRPPFRLEMGWGGLVAVITGGLAAIIWTFVLGVWVGKKVATPTRELLNPPIESKIQSRESYAARPSDEKPLFTMKESSSNHEKDDSTSKSLVPKEEKQAESHTSREDLVTVDIKPEIKSTPQRPQADTIHKVSKPSKNLSRSKPRPYFALQVASFRDMNHAQREVLRWRNRGFEAFIKKIDLGPKKGFWHRVCIGKYPSIEEAKKGAAKLVKKFKQKAYIIPVT